MKLTKRLAPALLLVAVASAQTPQTQDSNPNHPPEVFLDNHRPLIEKKGKAPTSRTVSGQVVDDSGKALEGALVTVTEPKSKEKRTFITKKDGRYSFDDLSFTQDYQLQARWKNLLSDERKLSQYDHSAKIVRILSVITPEGAASEAKKEEPKPKQ